MPVKLPLAAKPILILQPQSRDMPRVYLDTNMWSRAFDKPSERIIEETNAFFNI